MMILNIAKYKSREKGVKADVSFMLQINRLIATQQYRFLSSDNKKVFEGSIAISQIKRTLQELVSFVYRECSFPNGCLIMTGTGIVHGSDFTLKSGDEINISIDNIGTLSNTVQ